ncbi:hypothetical protein J7438_01885 [Thalassotalea sp. G20_0]|uniref:hypothetical protein n=1 Tax=Thalassotalea sp. G20_0 TaxID=2821093 RepID=UPI001ADB9F36|nr:hypothetical protein [Thalassotalea sp. G20_0]MBO9492844.1 hypothetical protein [Thalassotalea sp. G20_0]
MEALILSLHGFIGIPLFLTIKTTFSSKNIAIILFDFYPQFSAVLAPGLPGASRTASRSIKEQARAGARL